MSNRIQGARVKAAAAAHARKQLGNLGFRFKSGAGFATFQGDTAFAAWEAGDTEDWVHSFRINYPALPDNAMISRQEADFISAYTLHELGHVAFTKSGAAAGRGSLVHHLWNGIEDARIEHAVINSGKARNARSMFKKLMGKFTSKIVAGGDFNPCSINSAPFALALVCRAGLGDGNGFAKQLLNNIPEPYRSLYAAAAEGVKALPLDRSGSVGALNLALAFRDAWEQQFPEAFQQPVEPQPNPLGGEPQDGNQGEQAGAGDDDSDDQGSGPSGHWTPPAREQDDADDGFDDSPGYGGSLDAEEKAAQAEADALSDEAAANAEASDDSDIDGLLDSLAGTDSDSDDQEGGTDVGDPYIAPEDDVYSDDKVIAPEPNVDDLFQAVQQRTKGAINLRAVPPASRSEMRRWSKLAETTDRTVRSKLKKLNGSSLPALKAQLFRILTAPERCGWDGGAMGGRFDGKRAPRMLAGSEQVFKRRWFAEGVDTAVSVVVDLSASMKGSCINSAVDLGWAVATACEQAGTDVEVVGFQNSRYGNYGSGYDLKGDYRSTSMGGSDCTLIVAKRFADKCAAVPHFFDTMKKLPNYGTPDYEGIKTVCEQLSALPHQRKVVVVITDGFGAVEDMRRLTEAAYKLYGVDIVGFGMYTRAQDFSRAYAVGCPVDLSTLHKSSLKTVIKQLEQRDTRRVM